MDFKPGAGRFLPVSSELTEPCRRDEDEKVMDCVRTRVAGVLGGSVVVCCVVGIIVEGVLELLWCIIMDLKTCGCRNAWTCCRCRSFIRSSMDSALAPSNRGRIGPRVSFSSSLESSLSSSSSSSSDTSESRMVGVVASFIGSWVVVSASGGQSSVW